MLSIETLSFLLTLIVSSTLNTVTPFAKRWDKVPELRKPLLISFVVLIISLVLIKLSCDNTISLLQCTKDIFNEAITTVFSGLGGATVGHSLTRVYQPKPAASTNSTTETASGAGGGGFSNDAQG